MNSLVIFGCIIGAAMAQGPPYAGSMQKMHPTLASRFRDTSSSSVAPTANDTIVNRIGEAGPQTTIKIPVDARGNVDLVQRLNQWPRDNRPFWLINAEHIEKQRHPDGDLNQQVGSRSSFDPNRSSGVRTIRPPIQRSSFVGLPDRR